MNELMKTTSSLGVILEIISYFVLFLGFFLRVRLVVAWV